MDGAIGGYVGSGSVLGWGFFTVGMANAINKDIQSDSGLGVYESMQAFVGGGLSSLAGMQMIGMKTEALIGGKSNTIKLVNKCLGYGIQSTASDFWPQKPVLFTSKH